PAVATVVPAGDLTYTEVLQLAASLEKASEHPLAEAIVRAASQRNLELFSSSQFRAIAGKGVLGKVNGKHIALGNLKLLLDLGIDLPVPLRDQAESLRKEGHTIMFVVADGKIIGVLGVTDPIKQSAVDAIRRLHEEGVHIAMVTGDSRTTAEAVARKLVIDEV